MRTAIVAIGAAAVLTAACTSSTSGTVKAGVTTAAKAAATLASSTPAPGATTTSAPPPPPTTTAPPPKPAGPTRDNSTAKLATLGAGSFTVGKDVPAGRYVITPGPGQSGNLTGSTPDDPALIDEVLGVEDGLGIPSYTSTLTQGEQIKIDGMSQVIFTPAVTKLRTVIGSGDWIAGLDVPLGRYVVTPGTGQSGNFVVYDTDGTPGTDEVLGAADGLGVPSVTVDLTLGQVIYISGIPTVKFTAA